MGGRVFPGLTRRYLADEYFAIMSDVMDRLAVFCDRYDVIPGYGAKESFGDMDVLFIPHTEQTAGSLMSLFDTKHVSHNGGVWSLIYKELQIDLIRSNDLEYDYALNYFAYNDRGNLIGRYAHKMGLKHGHDCLKYPVRSKDTVLGEVVLTRDPERAERFLGIDTPGIHLHTLEDIFVNVAESKYFNPDIFLLDNRNHTSRVRDAKRPTYMSFLKWCETLPTQVWFNWNKDKSVYQEMIFSEFPHAREEVGALWDRKRYIDRAHERFNGDLVMQWTGLTGKELGSVMRVLKERLPPDVVLTLSQPEIMKIVQSVTETP